MHNQVWIKYPAFVFSFLWLLTGASSSAFSDTLYIATASNFKPALERIIESVKPELDAEVKVISSSTAKATTQILQGAPIDIFISADERSIKTLMASNRIVDTLKLAKGRVALFGFDHKPSMNLDTLSDNDVLAIANPKLAPYGRAAKEFISSKALETIHAKAIKQVYAENVWQAFNYVNSGQARAGIVAYSQIVEAGIAKDRYVIVEFGDYQEPLDQYVVFLTEKEAVRSFRALLETGEINTILELSGYIPQNVWK